jgi:hypothetical protein
MRRKTCCFAIRFLGFIRIHIILIWWFSVRNIIIHMWTKWRPYNSRLSLCLIQNGSTLGLNYVLRVMLRNACNKYATQNMAERERERGVYKGVFYAITCPSVCVCYRLERERESLLLHAFYMPWYMVDDVYLCSFQCKGNFTSNEIISTSVRIVLQIYRPFLKHLKHINTQIYFVLIQYGFVYGY